MAELEKSLGYKHVLADKSHINEMAKFLGRYYYSINGTYGGNSIGSLVYKPEDLDPKTGQYVRHEVLYECLETHIERYPETIDLIYNSEGKLILFNSAIIESTPLKRENFKFLFASPINWKLFNDLGVFGEIHETMDETNKNITKSIFNLPPNKKIIYGHIIVIAPEAAGNLTKMAGPIVENYENHDVQLVCGMAINKGSQALTKFFFKNGGIFNKVYYKDFTMEDGSKPLAEHVKPGFEYAYIHGEYRGDCSHMNVEENYLLMCKNFGKK